MTNAQLADFLNEKAGLAGSDAVTVNVIRQWVDWRVLPKAKAHGNSIGKGPDWSRDNEAQGRAIRLAELRKLGVRREAAVVSQAYIEWGHPDFVQVRNAVAKEFTKWRNQLNRPQTTFLAQSDFSHESAVTKRAIRNQSGPLDERLANSQFELSPELFARVSHFSRLGEGDPTAIGSLLSNAIEQMLPELATQLPNSLPDKIALSLSGLTGDPEEIENSGLEIISNADERKFEAARAITVKQLQFGTGAAQISQLAEFENAKELFDKLNQFGPQITVGPWALFLFVQNLIAIRNDPNWEFHISNSAI